MDIRERAIARLASGQTVREVAGALGVAASSVVKWSGRKRQSGSVAPGQMGGHRPVLITGKYRQIVLDAIASKSHVSLRELAAMLKEAGLEIHHVSVGRFLERERQSYKKNAVRVRTRKTKSRAPQGAVAKVSRPD
jgi:transposase